MLNEENFGRGSGTPLIIAHGLYGSARNWRAIAKALGATRPVRVVDMLNHGASPRDAEMSYQRMADSLAETMGAAPGVVLGHSMGGKAAMVLALSRPDLVTGLIVGDIAPVSYGHAAENAGYARAMQRLDLEGIGSRAEADRRLAVLIEDRALRAFFLQSLSLGPDGASWQLNLPVIEAALPDIVGFPEISGQYDGPVISLMGENSGYVDEAGRAAMLSRFPTTRFVTIKDAGHWLHADQPKAFIATMEAILARI